MDNKEDAAGNTIPTAELLWLFCGPVSVQPSSSMTVSTTPWKADWMSGLAAGRHCRTWLTAHCVWFLSNLFVEKGIHFHVHMRYYLSFDCIITCSCVDWRNIHFPSLPSNLVCHRVVHFGQGSIASIPCHDVYWNSVGILPWTVLHFGINKPKSRGVWIDAADAKRCVINSQKTHGSICFLCHDREIEDPYPNRHPQFQESSFEFLSCRRSFSIYL